MPDRRLRMQPVLHRLARLSTLSDHAVQTVQSLGAATELVEAKVALQSEDDAVYRARYIVAGWACRMRLLPDGRRQVFGFLLPGDGIGLCLHPNALANTTTVAVTRLELVAAGELIRPERLHERSELVQAILAAANEDERRLLDHVVRLGRLDALERVAHLLLELHDRLWVVGLAEGGRFALPLTQEMLADALGLSVVHINRTLQELRRQQLVAISAGQCTLLDRQALATLAIYTADERTAAAR